MPFLRNFVFVKYLALFVSVFWLIHIYFSSEVPADTGDGILHFFYSQASWNNPDLFLHHWGKPLFILVSSPFSQFGFTGIVIFNVLVFSLTCYIGFKILGKWKVSEFLQSLLPFILLIPNDMTITIIGGLTEPLFNLFIVLALYFLVKQNYLFFALTISLFPFLRSEGQLGIVIAIFILSVLREFKFIPYLFFGLLIYSIAGIFVYSDFFWYFTKSPYHMSDDMYGHGSWDHYFSYYKNYLGIPGLIISVIGLIAICLLFIQKKWEKIKWKEFTFTYGFFLGILLAHTYFWAYGKNGSIGLTRIATQGIPVFIILNLYYVQILFDKRIRLLNITSLAVLFILEFMIWTNKTFPIKANPLEKEILNAAEFMRTLKVTDEKILYKYPLFAFAYNENPALKNRKGYKESTLSSSEPKYCRYGDFIVRDSHFGPNEKGLSLKEIDSNPEFVLVAEFISTEQTEDPFGETEGVKIFQKIPLVKQKKVEQQRRKVILNKNIHIQKNEEFTGIESLVREHTKNNSKVIVVFSALEGNLKLVYDYNNSAIYESTDIDPNQVFQKEYTFRKEGETKLYFWNPNRVDAKILLKELIIEERNFHPIYYPR